MANTTDDKAFTGSIPALYETYLVPLIFEEYALDLARRVAARLALGGVEGPPRRVLEIAAGTGVVTRALAAVLPASTEIVAIDLNPAMLEQAARVLTERPVEFRQADAMALPFPDQSFDVDVVATCVIAVALGDQRLVQRPADAAVERTQAPGLLDRTQHRLWVDQHRKGITDDDRVLRVLHSKLRAGCADGFECKQ